MGWGETERQLAVLRCAVLCCVGDRPSMPDDTLVVPVKLLVYLFEKLRDDCALSASYSQDSFRFLIWFLAAPRVPFRI